MLLKQQRLLHMIHQAATLMADLDQLSFRGFDDDNFHCVGLQQTELLPSMPRSQMTIISVQGDSQAACFQVSCSL